MAPGFLTGRPWGLWRQRVVFGEGEFHKEALLRAGEYEVGPRSPFLILPHYDDDRALAVTEHGYMLHTGGDLWKLNLDTLEFTLDRRGIGGQYIDIDGDGIHECMGTGGGFSHVWVTDAQGRYSWYMPEIGMSRVRGYYMDAGDLDGDGVVEFYVGTKKGLMRKEADGTTVWAVEDSGPRRVKALEASMYKGTEGLIVSKVGSRGHYSRIEIRRSDGELVRQFKITNRHTNWELLPWPNGDAEFGILTQSQSDLVLYDDLGEVMWTYPFPKELGMKGCNLEAMMVQFRDGGPSYVVAMVHSYWEWQRQLLCIMTLEGEPAYVELFPRARFAVGVLGARPEATDRVLFVSTKEKPQTLYAYWPR